MYHSSLNMSVTVSSHIKGRHFAQRTHHENESNPQTPLEKTKSSPSRDELDTLLTAVPLSSVVERVTSTIIVNSSVPVHDEERT
ncbi:hypothetical protein D9619_008606 [Psilocybe cf. subviscida]|uniref:Uncharacterized protein n=1 Tax=Psilocybe cf. subviscida TaxID=2480587 RepID=A0A8H5BCK8_9AGAR|nr:hypothetical protein D9619_008606 [Psilocybe cf. subviscida]